MYVKGVHSNGHHAMRLAGSRLNYHEFVCDICGRHVLVHLNPSSVEEDERSFVVLKQGDLKSSHSGGNGGLAINGIGVEQDSTELSDEWKAWLADILDDVE